LQLALDAGAAFAFRKAAQELYDQLSKTPKKP
jgi:hypothetical protein